MKKLLFLLIAITILLIFSIKATAASITPNEYSGNEKDSQSYSCEPSCIIVTLPNSDVIGTHKYRFDDNGNLSINGTNILTIIIESSSETPSVKNISWSWSGSYKLHSILVCTASSFNDYNYNGTTLQDKELQPPQNESDNEQELDHISIVISPFLKISYVYSQFEIITLSLFSLIIMLILIIIRFQIKNKRRINSIIEYLPSIKKENHNDY